LNTDLRNNLLEGENGKVGELSFNEFADEAPDVARCE
jgi:hypothetical protein